MKKFATLALAVSAIGAASVANAANILEGAEAFVVKNYQVGQQVAQGPMPVVAPGAVYSNVTNFGGTGITVSDSPSTSTFTYAIADDLTTTLTQSGKVTNFRFSIVNFNSTATLITPYVRFYDDDGANGGPGTFLAGFNFNAVTVPASNVTTLGVNVPVANQFNIPTGKIWGVQFFSTASAAATGNVGVGVFSPPDVGSSTALLEWDSNALATAGTSFTGNNPAGFLYTQGYSGGTVPSNFGWEIVATVPEPVTLGAVAGLGLVLRRRRA